MNSEVDASLAKQDNGRLTAFHRHQAWDGWGALYHTKSFGGLSRRFLAISGTPLSIFFLF